MIRLLPLVLATAGSVFSVDDDHPADFSDLPEAVSSPLVAPGDLLVVEPGTYSGFVLDRSLRIVGRANAPPPVVQGDVTVTAPAFRFAGLSLQGVEIHPPAQAGSLESCTLSGSATRATALRVFGPARLLLSRCFLLGAPSPTAAGGEGLVVEGGRAVLAETVVLGGLGSVGAPAVRALAGSELAFAGGALLGGDGSPPGVGLELAASRASVRGSPLDAVLPGGGPAGGAPAPSFLLSGGSVLVLGPVQALGASLTDPGDLVVQPASPEPYLRHVGPDALGSNGAVLLFASAGAPALVLLSESDALVDVPELQDPLWIDPHDLLFAAWLTAAGEFAPSTVSFAVPAAAVLEGRSFRFQAAFPTLTGALDAGKSAVTPPVEVLLRP